MLNRAVGNRGRWWPTPSFVVASVAVAIGLGGSAVAAGHLINTKDIATSAVTGGKIRNGTIRLVDVSASTQAALRARKGSTGSTGALGATGTPGAKGNDGTNGTNGANGANGANGPNGPNGADGTNGSDGTNGANGANGIIAPLSVSVASMPLPTSSSRTVVATLAVPAGNYVVVAKTQLTQTGAGDTVDCYLRAGSTDIDQVSMKTLPALAAVPASLEAVTTTSPVQLSLECKVLTAGGSADFTKLIAIPIG